MTIKEVKLCLLGDAGVGKSSIAIRFAQDTFKTFMEATIGAAFLTKSIHVDDTLFKYQIWDTAGQEKYRALAPMYYRGATAAVVVYDITKQQSFKMIQSWVDELKKHGPTNIILAIAGNKCDLEKQREVQTADAEEYATNVGAIFFETSAKSSANVSSIFTTISQRILSSESAKGKTKQYTRNNVSLTTQDKTKRTCCG